MNAKKIAKRPFRPGMIVALAAVLGAVLIGGHEVSASAETLDDGPVAGTESASARQFRAAGYELAAWAEGDGRRINLWVIQGPAGGWTWHGHLERGRPGDHVWTENTWGNVVSSAHVPPGQTGVNTGDWSSRGSFQVCGKGVDRPSGFCSSFGSRG